MEGKVQNQEGNWGAAAHWTPSMYVILCSAGDCTYKMSLSITCCQWGLCPPSQRQEPTFSKIKLLSTGRPLIGHPDFHRPLLKYYIQIKMSENLEIHPTLLENENNEMPRCQENGQWSHRFVKGPWSTRNELSHHCCCSLHPDAGRNEHLPSSGRPWKQQREYREGWGMKWGAARGLSCLLGRTHIFLLT